MGRSPRVLVFVLLLVMMSVRPVSPSLCDYSQCNCASVGLQMIVRCAFNSTQKQLDINPDTLPRNLAELEISGPREVVFYSGSFPHNLTFLNLVRLTDVGALTVEPRAFARLAYPQLRLEVVSAQRVIIQSSAFHDLRSATVTAKLERIYHLVIQEHAFNRLLDLEIRNVTTLELHPNAFFFESDQGKESQGPATKILLERVKVKELPQNVFPALNQLVIRHSEVGQVKREAFRALEMTSVILENTTVQSIQTEAFTTRGRIGLLRLENVRVGLLESSCLLAGIQQLVVRGSSLGDISEAAFNTYAAAVTLSENIFNRVRRKGFTLKETTMLAVENNRFNILEGLAFVLPEGEIPDQLINLTFRGNSLGKTVGKAILDFSRKQLGLNINNNSFDYQCQCEAHTKSWMKERVNGSDSVVDEFYNTSLCQVDLRLSQCFSVPPGSLMMGNFTALACDGGGEYYCPEVVLSDASVPSSPGDDPLISDHSNSVDRERTVLGLLLVFVTSGVVLMLILSGFMWLRRHGYCTKARLLLLPSADSVFDILSRAVVGSSTATAPASAPPGHDYAELQAHRPGEDSAEEDVLLEDKATQTLPEELTQELLQSLREKLDDPDNYGEARDMIEHLYDLIKVEESCNRNSDFTSLQMEELDVTPPPEDGENVYDVIQPKVKPKRIRGERKSLVSVGTRAPSPDKLLPLSLSRRKPAVLCDYAEPKDRTLHVYQELPVSLSPDSKELPTVMVNRPLPSKPDNGCDTYL